MAELKRSNRPVSRTDVARKAGVSRTTVSNVINGTGYVTSAVRQQVLAAIKEMGYYPNPIARGLATNRSQQVAVLVESLDNPFFARLVTTITYRLHKEDLNALVVQGKWVDARYVGELYQGRVDGCIIADGNAQLSPRAIETLHSRGVPLIGHCLEAGDLPVASIDPDFTGGMRQLVDHLVKLGHTRVAFLSPTLPGRKEARLSALEQISSQFGLQLDPALVSLSRSHDIHSMAAGREATMQLLQAGADFTAIIAANDLMAIGALRALQEHGRQVPAEVSVVGWDDIPFATYTAPSLTTVAVSPDAIAERLVSGLTDCLEGRSAASTVVEVVLRVRESSGPAQGRSAV